MNDAMFRNMTHDEKESYLYAEGEGASKDEVATIMASEESTWQEGYEQGKEDTRKSGEWEDHGIEWLL